MHVYHQILTRFWGYTQFRPLQEDIIRSVAEEKKDTLGLLPTGGGKSILFQVPALAQEGICIVITPLVALMKDQVENLLSKKIKAIAIHSALTKDEIDIALNNCIFGGVKFLYIAPERIATEIFQVRVQKMNVNLIAVDEAHCISQWGYDFRPSYLKIAEIRQLVPNVPILALTASATPIVVKDIQEKLQFRENNVFRKSFERKNLVYLVRETEDKLKYLLKIVTTEKGSGIVYVRSRGKTREIAEYLKQNNVSADYFHAGLKNETKDQRQIAWKYGNTRIIVATNAFGMGIDKADVRVVVHYEMPDSLEAYYQEAGRAGRDEKKSWCVVLFQQTDTQKIENFIESNFPEKEIIKRVYNALGNYFQIPVGAGKDVVLDFDIANFSSTYKLPIITIYNALKILQAEGYIEYTDEIDNPSRLRFIVGRDDLYKFQVANEKFDLFIKLILRSYTGVFSDYVKIDENQLARRSNTTRDVIYNYLLKLSNAKIIKYIPQKRTPLIVFTEERLPENSLFLSPENYIDRKKRYSDRISSVINYLTSTSKCRSQILLNYFGEEEPMRCGQCDNCLKRNELNLSKYEFDIILEKIKEALNQKAWELPELVDSIPYDSNNVIKVVQWLLDSGKIQYNSEQKLEKQTKK